MQEITLILITCKRFSLFQKTIESFQKKCKDIYLISNIILIDDNSDLPDLILMQDMIKRFNKPYLFINKYENKGHPYSMNIAWSLVKTDYCLLLEDDWLMQRSDNIIEKAFEIFKKHDDVVQVQYRHNPDIMAVNQKVLKLKDIQYVNYDYNVQAVDSLGRPCFPGFTLNPSLINVKRIKESVGLFSEEFFGFEFNYSCRVAGKGYKVCYFDENYFLHIGKNNDAYRKNGTRR
jgi:hypothetical protein